MISNAWMRLIIRYALVAATWIAIIWYLTKEHMFALVVALSLQKVHSSLMHQAWYRNALQLPYDVVLVKLTYAKLTLLSACLWLYVKSLEYRARGKKLFTSSGKKAVSPRQRRKQLYDACSDW